MAPFTDKAFLRPSEFLSARHGLVAASGWEICRAGAFLIGFALLIAPVQCRRRFGFLVCSRPQVGHAAFMVSLRRRRPPTFAVSSGHCALDRAGDQPSLLHLNGRWGSRFPFKHHCGDCGFTWP